MSNETQQKQGFEIHPPGWRPSDDALESWQRTHAQLLKSVADAQAKLLAAQNEITDKLDKLSEYSTHNLEVAERRINERLSDLPHLAAKLDAIGTMLAKLADQLAPPRWQVERLRTKRIVKAPQRKQRR